MTRKEERTQAAIAAMQGLLANSKRVLNARFLSYTEIAERSIGYADALIEGLKKGK